MTQEELMALGLEEGAAEQVLALHMQAMNERTQELQQASAERDALRLSIHRDRAESALREALLTHGANPKAVPLLMRGVNLDTLQPDDAEGMQAATEALMAQYGDFFSQEQAEPLEDLHPPEGMAMLNRDMLRGMDCGEINRRWYDVRLALGME